MLAAYLLTQQQSPWEELWSEGEGVFYYYHKVQGQSIWNPPVVPYRPMVRDRFTQRLMQAWPQMEHPDEAPAAERGMCMRCRVEVATRTCNECVPRKPPPWAKLKFHVCFVCFAEEHAMSAEMRAHTFTVARLAKAPPLACCICAAMATRRCRGPGINPEVFTAINGFIHAPGASEVPKLPAFRNFVALHRLPFSSERCSVLFQECHGGPESSCSAADVWRAFLKVLEAMREECSDTYCAKCWRDTHKKGRRGKHEWSGFAEAALVCAMCEKNVAERHCEACVDDLCTACAVATHLRGKKHRHAMLPIREALGKSQRHCTVCDIRAGDVECPLCEAPHCDSCLEFRHAECAKKGQVGDAGKPSKCSVCGRNPDTQCEECGDVYCSVVWMGNAGCFAKLHRKGNRQQHHRAPYTHVGDAAAAQKRAKRARKREAKEARWAEERAAAEERHREEGAIQRLAAREARIVFEAEVILAAKKKGKTWLPTIKGSPAGFLAPIRAAIASHLGLTTVAHAKSPI